MSLTAVECPGDVCHSHHGGHEVERVELRQNLKGHGHDWCERLAERIYEISVDTFSQMVLPMLQQQGWQRRHLEWEFKLSEEPMEVERTLADGTVETGSVEWGSDITYLQVADPPVGILFFLAMSSLAVYGIMLAGWSSGSKYPLLGSVRASAQLRQCAKSWPAMTPVATSLG